MKKKRSLCQTVITSEEYRELITEAVEFKHLYDRERSECRDVANENVNLKCDLDRVSKKLAYYVYLYGEITDDVWVAWHDMKGGLKGA